MRTLPERFWLTDADLYEDRIENLKALLRQHHLDGLKLSRELVWLEQWRAELRARGARRAEAAA